MSLEGIRFSCLDFLKLTEYSLLIGSLTIARGAEYALQTEPVWLEVTHLHLRLRRLSPAFSGFRLAQISDIHMGGWMNRERLDQVVQKVLAEAPDMIALTGDFLPGFGWDDNREQALGELASALKPLTDFSPILMVMGNHDYWTDPRKIRRKLREMGILELSNSVYTLQRGDDTFHICGVDDVYEGRDRIDVLLSRLPDDGAAMLLCHEPDFADTSAATGRFDLQISGHSHGGQIVLPLIGTLHTPKHGHKYPLGLYRVGDMLQYTNRGVGMASIPVRLNCRPEITIYTLESEI
jgi:uncharacterized protein